MLSLFNTLWVLIHVAQIQRIRFEKMNVILNWSRKLAEDTLSRGHCIWNYCGSYYTHTHTHIHIFSFFLFFCSFPLRFSMPRCVHKTFESSMWLHIQVIFIRKSFEIEKDLAISIFSTFSMKMVELLLATNHGTHKADSNTCWTLQKW